MWQRKTLGGLLIASVTLAATFFVGCERPVYMDSSDSARQDVSSSADVVEGQADLASYEAQREVLLAQELSPERLSNEEVRVSEKLRSMKAEASALYGGDVAYGINQWSSSASAETKLHAFCASMPKGANLHVHDTWGISADGLMEVLLGRGDVLVDVDAEGDYGKLYLEGSPDVPETVMPLKDALGVSDAGQDEGEQTAEEETDEEGPVLSKEALRDMFTLGAVRSSRDSWAAMEEARGKMANLMSDDSFVRALYEAGFKEQAKNGVNLVELRVICGEDDQANARLLNAVRDAYYAVKRERPSFVVRVIASANKNAQQSKDSPCNALRSAIRLATQIKDESDANNPRDFIVGLDLVGNEDEGLSLKEFVDFLGSDEVSNSGLGLYLHCGESLAVQNDSVVDAYLLGAKRIGHGINLCRYPALMDSYAKDSVAIEVSPMSDYRLGYVSDLRLHPGSLYVHSGNQVVLCADASTFVEPSVLVDDFYAATLCWDLSLADLKALCRNSITYSSLPREEKNELMAAWEDQWGAFIKAQLAQTQ